VSNTSIERQAEPVSLDEVFGKEEPIYRPDDPELYGDTSWEDAFVNGLKKSAKQFIDSFLAAFLDKG